ncbi:hypothetical protein ACQP00_12930 [Dactylosporangium sp. CS-047395]|uniref:hypothetical protein n=1 Tax=Dactylosporangium sp. CS-047395 TaxID=3239936 RepID=UPI003D8BD72F
MREALTSGPVLAGPLEMGLFAHQPGMTGPIEADHFVVVLSADDELVRFHDPHGHPYATLPTDTFLAAWKGETIGYRSTDYTLRYAFNRAGSVTVADALRDAVPSFAAWLRGRFELPVPPDTRHGADALHALADRVEAGLPDDVRAHLTHFAVRVGARRLSDAAAALASLGLVAAAQVLTEQSMLVGGLQYAFVADDRTAASRALRALAPTYAALAATLP